MTIDIKDLLNKIAEGIDLTSKEAEGLLEEIIEGKLTQPQIAAVLMGLRTKGEAVLEIVGFIKAMRKHMLSVESKGLVIDIVGTGGDGAGTFNISTASSFVVAGAGVGVAKHGNRAASSCCGSADVLEKLGVNIYLKPQEAKEVLEKAGMVFLFAPMFHPAMKNIAPIRKELKIRTVFNYLGPFLNPALTKRQLVGVPNVEVAKKLAQVVLELNFAHLIIFASEDNMDEISTSGKTHLFEIRNKKVKTRTIDPLDFGIKKRSKRSILGGNPSKNAKIIKDVLSGKKRAARDIVLLNSAFALLVSGIVKNINQGIKLAEKSIDSGEAKKVLEKLIEETNKCKVQSSKFSPRGEAGKITIQNLKVIENNFISKIIRLKKKDIEIQKRVLSFKELKNKFKITIQNLKVIENNFKSAIQRPKNKSFAIIAEIKLASPTMPNLGLENELITRARLYEQSGADIISLITEKHFFKGRVGHVEEVKSKVSLPILQKDFVIDQYQIYEAKKAGADSILLIAKLIEGRVLVDFVSLAKKIGIEPLVEINDENDLEKALATSTEIIAVNARDLNNFTISLDKACDLLSQIPDSYIKLGFSGISSKAEVQKYLNAGAGGILVGTNLMRAGNVKEFLKDLI